MIFGRLQDRERYSFLDERILRVLDFAAGLDKESFEKGRVDLDGDKLFVNRAAYTTHDSEGALSEAHRKYIDVFVMIDGEETVYVKPTDKLSTVTKEYSEDIEALLALTDGDASAIRLVPGDFLILYPEDAHAPGCYFGGPSDVKKAIGKVLI